MDKYRVRSNGKVLTKSQAKKTIAKGFSLPNVWDKHVTDELGLDPILKSPKPTLENELQVVQEQAPIRDSLENWVESWVVIDKFTDYVDGEGITRSKVSQDAAYLVTLAENKMASVRRERDKLLSETDHFALVDYTLTDEMRTYRQALRDFPSVVDLDNIVYPTKP
jgi:hypothetical protein